jgi:hypothetical protein
MGIDLFPELAAGVGATYSSRPDEIVYLAGTPFPGICEIKGIAQLLVNTGGGGSGGAMGTDVKKAPGRDGATITVTGYQPGPFEFSCMFWTLDQWEVLQVLIDSFFTRPNKKQKLKELAHDIHHPHLEMLKIKSAVIQGVTFPEPGPVVGSRVVRFKMFENVPPGPKKKTATVKGSNVGVVPELRKNEQPKNAAPAPPSQNKKNLAPSGQPTPPGGGSV